MKARLLFDSTFGPEAGADLHNTTVTAGTIIDRPDAWMLVGARIAVPADEECAQKTKQPLVMSQEEETAFGQAYRRVEAGIDPADYEAFDAGFMTGYDENGDWIPGPNYVESDSDDVDEVDELTDEVNSEDNTDGEAVSDE